MDTLILKYLQGTINDEELLMLYQWVQKKENKDYFKQYVKLNHKMHLMMQEVDPEEAFLKVNEKIRQRKGVFRRVVVLKRKYIPHTAAAVILVFLGLLLWIKMLSIEGKADRQIRPISDMPVSVELSNGEIAVLDSGKKIIQEDSLVVAVNNSGSNKLSYLNQDLEIKGDIPLNTIRIPYGKKYTLILADSTVVHLNSGATMQYPISFAHEGQRMVRVSGEAFFEVHKDKEHPFIVSTKAIEVEVLGTSFNISSYPKNNTSEVVLVEGSVKMMANKQDKVQILSPGFKGEYNELEGAIAVDKVNTEIYTSWVYGKLIFKERSFDQIIQTLERNFNVAIINKNKSLKGEKLNATFAKDEDLMRILFYMEKAYKIKYRVENNQIIIN